MQLPKGATASQSLHLIGKIKMTQTKQVTVKKVTLTRGTEGEWFSGGVCAGSRQVASWGFLQLVTEWHCLGREGGRWREAYARAPKLPYQANVSHAPTSPHLNCYLCSIQRSSFIWPLSRDRGLGFEEHLWMLDSRGRVNSPLLYWGLDCASFPLSRWAAPFPLLTMLHRPLVLRVWSKDQHLWLVRDEIFPV